MTNNLKLNQTLSAKSAGPKKRKIASLDRRKARAGWIFVLPFIIGFILVYVPMVFDSIKLSFTELKYLPGGGYDPQWVGLDNYAEALLGGIKSRKLGAACLDVYEEESELFFEDFSGHIVDDDILARLISMPNVLVTSHQAFLTEEALDNIAQTTVGNIAAFLCEGKRENEVSLG